MTETERQPRFDAVLEADPSLLGAGRIRWHPEAGGERDGLTEIGRFLLEARTGATEVAVIECFVDAGYRSRRAAIEEAIRELALTAIPEAQGRPSELRLCFFWTTP